MNRQLKKTRYNLEVLPRLHSASFEGLLSHGFYFRRLISFDKFFDLFVIFIVFPGNDEISVRGILIFCEQALFFRIQSGLRRKIIIDNCQCHFLSSKTLGICGASNSRILKFLGFSVISATFGNSPMPSFSLIRPCF